MCRRVFYGVSSFFKMSSQQSNAKKRQKIRSFFASQAKREAGRQVGFGIEPGQSGFLVTCTRGKEGRCVMEMYTLLNDVSSMWIDEKRN
jgi:hypothetical protein